MVGVAHVTLIQAFQGGSLSGSKLIQMLMDAGFDDGSLASFAKDGVPDTAIAVIATYYGFEAGRNCTAKARSTVLAFSSIGIRTYIQKMVGFEEKQQTPAPILQVVPSLSECKPKSLRIGCDVDECWFYACKPNQFRSRWHSRYRDRHHC